MYTPDFKNLYENFFLPSLKDDFDLVVKEYPQDCSTGIFRSVGWNKTMLNKLELLESAILENWDNQIFFYSDIDIVFLKPALKVALKHLGNNDFVVQQSWPRNTLCAGFFVMRGNTKTLNLITTAYQLLHSNICIDDQVALQTALEQLKQDKIKWKFLPSEEFSTGRRVLKHTSGYYTESSEIELSDSIILFHATSCLGIESKYHFLKRVQDEYFNN